jgi:cytochrome c oxidase subunit 1
LAGFGGYLLVIGIGIMFVNLLMSFRRAVPAPADPWGGTTLEWKIPSPPPVQNFVDTPQILDFPYDFNGVGEDSQKAEQ